MTPAGPVEVFDAASRLSADARGPFLDERCAGAPALREEVESLLAHFDAAQGFMTRGLYSAPIVEPKLALAGMLAPGMRVSSYRIERVLGQGGMGVVYVAVQDNPSRKVALKVIRPGAGDRSMLRRFEREAQLLGRLQHPGIAQIFEAGVARMGEPGATVELPFLAMELVDGQRLAEYAAAQRLDTRAKLGLIAKVCDAVEHAHQRGLIHRDLKPGNILVTAAGQPKVLDFGVARALDQGPNVTLATEAGQLLGTLAYMSPEQVDGDPAHLDARSDVYALGVILYELLCGRLPHDLRARTVLGAAREIREREPDRLSSIERALRGDIETIVGRAIEKDRDRRYATAAALGEDLRRYLSREPILARQDSALYVLNKKLRRYRWAVSAALVFVALVLAFGAWAEAQARAFRALAVSEAAAKVSAQRSEARVREQLRVSDVERGRLLTTRGDLRGAERALWGALARAPAALDTRWALRELFATYPCLSELRGEDEDVFTARFSPDGAVLACGGDSGRITIFDPSSGARLCTLTDHTKRLNCVRFNPDGTMMASCALDSVIHLWNTRDWSPTGELRGHWASTADLAFSADGLRLYSTGQDGTVKLWDIPSRTLIREDGDRTLTCWTIVLDEARGRVFTSNQIGAVQVRDARSLELISEFYAHPSTCHAAALSPDGRTLATAGREGTVALWDAQDLSLIRRADPNVRNARHVVFSPDGSRIAVTGTWTTVVVDAATLEPVTPTLPEINGGWSAAFSPDGGTLATTSNGPGAVFLWPVSTGLPVKRITAHSGGVRSLSASPDGSRIATGAQDGSYALWDAATGQQAQRWTTRSPVRALAFSPDGRWLISAHANATVRAARTGHPEQPMVRFRGHRGSVEALACLPDGRPVSGGVDGTIRVWDWATQQPLALLQAGGRVGCLAVSPDGRWIVASAGERTGILWDARTYELVNPGTERSGPQTSGLAFSPDSRSLLTTTGVGGVEWSDPLTGVGRPLAGHTRYAGRANFAPDGRSAATASQDGLLNIWELPSGRCLASLPLDEGKLLSLIWQPDRGRAFTTSGTGIVCFWDLSSLDARVARSLALAPNLPRAELDPAPPDEHPPFPGR